jgi:tRNA 5-methylaminomethyl-2-thiouridine biosynthesis bifunctional protein
MASANPAALISPRLAAGSHAAAMLHAQAFRRAVDLVRRTAGEAVIATGAVHLLKGPGEAERAEATLSSGLFDPGSLVPLPPPAMSGLLGERVSSPGLDMAEALVVDPAVLRAAWLGAEIGQVSVACVERAADGWHVLDETGALVALADQVVIAAGAGTARLAGLPLRPVRGQVSLSPQALAGAAASWGGYAIPTRRGLLFGATHDRGNNDPSVRSEDNDRNLAALASVRPVLAARLDPGTLTGAAGVRSAAGDHQPVAGAVGPGLFVLGGLAGRGFTLAPLLADHVAALMLGLPSPLLAAQQRLVDPARLRAADEP